MSVERTDHQQSADGPSFQYNIRTQPLDSTIQEALTRKSLEVPQRNLEEGLTEWSNRQLPGLKRRRRQIEEDTQVMKKFRLSTDLRRVKGFKNLVISLKAREKKIADKIADLQRERRNLMVNIERYPAVELFDRMILAREDNTQVRDTTEVKVEDLVEDIAEMQISKDADEDEMPNIVIEDD